MKIGNLVTWHGQFASLFGLEGSIGVVIDVSETTPVSWWVQFGSEKFSIPEQSLKVLCK
jgi:hypothetical protein